MTWVLEPLPAIKMRLIKVLLLSIILHCSMMSFGQQIFVSLAEKQCSCIKEINVTASEDEVWNRMRNCLRMGEDLYKQSIKQLEVQFPQLIEADYEVMLADSVLNYLTKNCPAYNLVNESLVYRPSNTTKELGDSVCDCLSSSKLTTKQLDECFKSHISRFKKEGKILKVKPKILRNEVEEYLVTFCHPYLEIEFNKLGKEKSR